MPTFSMDMEVVESTSEMVLRAASTRSVTDLSISSGEAP